MISMRKRLLKIEATVPKLPCVQTKYSLDFKFDLMCIGKLSQQEEWDYILPRETFSLFEVWDEPILCQTCLIFHEKKSLRELKPSHRHHVKYVNPCSKKKTLWISSLHGSYAKKLLILSFLANTKIYSWHGEGRWHTGAKTSVFTESIMIVCRQSKGGALWHKCKSPCLCRSVPVRVSTFLFLLLATAVH